MSKHLYVKDGELKDFMHTLKKAKNELKGVRKALGEATIGSLGTDDLDNACESFQSDWQYGAEQIGKQTEELWKILDKSQKNYDEVDRALEKALDKAKEKGEAKSK